MSDAYVGYPPGLTRERLISFARNTVNSETTVCRDRVELIWCSFLSHPTLLFIENVGLLNYQNTLINSREVPK
jgi:hypothetical protein